jgi:hypothetical protein
VHDRPCLRLQTRIEGRANEKMEQWRRTTGGGAGAVRAVARGSGGITATSSGGLAPSMVAAPGGGLRIICRRQCRGGQGRR